MKIITTLLAGMKMKSIKPGKIIVLMMVGIASIAIFSGCSKQDSDDVQEQSPTAVEEQAPSDIESGSQEQGSYVIKDDGNYVASGTIPASAKIYPVVDESFPMIIANNENDLLDFEDIWIINHYIDVFASLDDAEGDGIKKDELARFLTSYTVDEIITNNETTGSHHKLMGVQVLEINIMDTNTVEAAYLERTSYGPNFSQETFEDTVSVLCFKRDATGKWFEKGIDHVKTDKTGTFSVVWDDSIGKISIKYPE